MSLVSITKLSELTGLSNQTLGKRLDGFPFVSHANAKLYESKDVLPVLYGAGGSSMLVASDQKARLLLHQANTAELKEKEMRKQLIPVEEVSAFLGGMVKRARSRLLPLGGIVQNQVTDLAQIKATIDKEIRRVLNELSETVKSGD